MFKRLLPPLLLLIGLIALQAWNPSPVQAIRFKIFDAYQRALPAEPAADPTLIVDIDDRSLAEIGQWPWDRATIARLVDGINEGGPKAIGLDIVFPEADRLSPPRMAEKLRQAGLAEPAGAASLPDTDKLLSKSIADAPVVAAIAAAPIAGQNPLPVSSIATIGGAPDSWVPRFTGAVANLPLIVNHAKGAGNITIEPGLDGVVRQMPLLSLVDNTLLPSLSLEVVRVAAGEKTLVVRTKDWGVAELITGEAKAPTDGHGRVWLHYAPHRQDRFISALDILDGKIPAETFAGKHVLVGSSAFGLWDIRATPLGYSLPGVEIQAQLIDSLRANDILERPNYMIGFELLMTLGAGLFLILVFNQVGASWTLVGQALIVIALLGASWMGYADYRLLIDGSYSAIASLLLYLAMVYAGHVRSETRREGLANAFKKYLSPVLVERLSRDGADVNLGGELKETTTLFADLRGFTPLSERLQREPQRLTRIVNKLLDTMSDAVLENDGTIDKFMGDNIMAFWNAPLDEPRHARKACLAAVAMQRRVATLDHTLKNDPEWADVFDGSIHLAAGIGINTGNCVVGNFGSKNRFDYSAIGDAVNLASRLEGAAKRYDVAALVTEATVTHVNDGTAAPLAFLPLGNIFVRGRAGNVAAFALVGDDTRAADPAFHALAHTHGAALAAAGQGAWDEFRAAIAEAKAMAPDLALFYDVLARERTPNMERRAAE